MNDFLYLFSLDSQDSEGQTPLIRAVIKGDYSLVKLLVILKAKTYIRDHHGKTAMDYAKSHPKLADFFDDVRISVITSNIGHIKKWISTNNINQLVTTKTLIHWASDLNNHKVMRFLLNRGADPNIPSISGETPLLTTNNVRTINILLKYGADPAFKEPISGNTAIINMTYINFKGGIEAILRSSQNKSSDSTRSSDLVNISNNINLSPLMIAAMNNNTAIIHLLMSYRANVDYDVLGNTALGFAVRRQNVRAVFALMTYNPNLKIRNSFNRSILDIALLSPPIIASTIISRFTLQEIEENGYFYVVENQYIENDIQLLSMGMNPNVQDEAGFTPLMGAVIQENASRVKLYLSRGANPHLKNNEGLTVYDYAEKQETLKILKLLPKLDVKTYWKGLKAYILPEPENLKSDLELVDPISFTTIKKGTEYLVARTPPVVYVSDSLDSEESETLKSENIKSEKTIVSENIKFSYNILGTYVTVRNLLEKRVRGTNDKQIFVPSLNICLEYQNIFMTKRE